MGWPLTRHLYRGVTGLAAPFVPILLNRRLAKGKEHPERMAERLGHPGLPRPEGRLVWLHGASVGETMSLLPLIEPLQERGLNVLLTSGTVTSAEIADRRLPEGAIHQFAPIDAPAAARRFVAHWRPDLVIFAESELWPNLLGEAKRAGARLAIVNGRMSVRSTETWKKLPSLIGSVLGDFDLVLGQSEDDAARYRDLGASGATSVGNIKFDGAPLPADAGALDALRGRIDGRPVFVAASTHPGEEEIVIAAHLGARQALPNLMTVIAPRHPERGESLLAMAGAAGLKAVRRAGGGLPEADTDLYIADTVGEMGLIYRLSGLAFVGGSFAPRGGQNPIEPAKLDVAILHGPVIFNFPDIYPAFDRDGGALEVEPDRLGPVVAELLTDPARLAAMQASARATADGLGGALARTLAALDALIARLGSRP